MRMEPQGPRTLRSSHHCPTQTSAEIEAAVLEAKERTGYGRKRLAWYLWRKEGLALSSHTICHTLSKRVQGPQEETEDVLPRPLGVGGGEAVCPGPGGREGRARQWNVGN
jgi:8-oxo-dGTP pyrophosphatase MutT (NUDIX family)